MEIPSNMPMGTALLKTQLSISVQKLTMEAAVQDSEALRQLMEKSVNPGVGQNIDIKV